MTAGRGRPTPVPAVAGQAWGTGLALLVGSAARFGAAFLAARALGVEGFGVYVLATTLVGLAGVLGAAGLSPGALPFLARARAGGAEGDVRAVARAVLGVVLVLSALGAAGLLLLAEPLARGVFAQPGLAAALRMFAGAVLLSGLVEGTRSLLHGLGAVAQQQWLERVLQVVVTSALLAVAWWADLGLVGVAAATYAGLAAAAVGALGLLRRRLPPGRAARAEPGLVLALLRGSWPLLGTSVLTFTLLWTDVLLMGVFGAAAEVGAYAACARLGVAALLVQEALGPTLLAAAAERHAARDTAGLTRVYRLTVGWSLGPGLVLIGALGLWAPEWLGLFGPEFGSAAPALRVLLAGKAVALLCGMTGRVYAVTGLERRHLLNTLALFGLNVALNCWWIPTHGMLGAAAATAVSLAATRSYQLLELGRLRGLWPYGREAAGVLLGVPALAAAVRALEHLGGWPWPLAAGLFLALSLAGLVGLGRSAATRARA